WDAVLVLQAVQQHVELELAHRADDRAGPDDRLLVEDLGRAFLGELPEPGVELLSAERVGEADPGKELGREAGDVGELETGPFGERVADAQGAAVVQADHVPRPGFLDGAALPGQK